MNYRSKKVVSKEYKISGYTLANYKRYYTPLHFFKGMFAYNKAGVFWKDTILIQIVTHRRSIIINLKT